MKKHSIVITMVILGLLALIFGVSFLEMNILTKSSSKFEKSISEVQNHIYTGNWSGAEIKLRNFEEEWSKSEKTWAILIDHLEIDNIENSVKKLGQFVATQNLDMSLAEIANLKQYITHIPEKESFMLKNIF